MDSCKILNDKPSLLQKRQNPIKLSACVAIESVLSPLGQTQDASRPPRLRLIPWGKHLHQLQLVGALQTLREALQHCLIDRGESKL